MTPPKIRSTTSASNLARRRDCPGSARMEDGIIDNETEYSAEGQLLHGLFLTRSRPAILTQEQIDTLDRADDRCEKHIEEWCSMFDLDPRKSIIEREVPLIIYDHTGSELFPGHADYVQTWPAESFRLIIDAKFGYTEVEHAADNLQLASYGIAMFDRQLVQKTAVAITQPRNFGPQFSAAMYTEQGIEDARREIERVIEESQKPDAPLIAGQKQCNHCKAKTFCPAYRAEFSPLISVGKHALDEVSNADLERLKFAIQFAEKIKNDVNAELRKRIQEDRMPGWKLRNTGDNRALEYPTLMREFMAETFQGNEHWHPDSLDACWDIKWGKLTEYVMLLTGKKKKPAEEWIKENINQFCTITPKDKSPVLEKAADPLELLEERGLE